ncbi:hypothetical protein [Asaia krungthepensis]|uniref:hypothetical protein n=1 Tax=Asaia krungthepensis TaxID=220990 RepID=UPI0022312932|nr:hypothetical protein [Asaia krungthepensis]
MAEPHIIDRLTAQHRADAAPERPRPKASGRGKTRKKRLTIDGNSLSVNLLDETLRRDLAHAIVRCTSFYSLEQRDDLVEQSAAFLNALIRLWASRGIDPQAVWREIDHRVQLGNLLNQINRDIPSSVDTARRFWRPSSTKLP